MAVDRITREAHAYVEQLGHPTTETNVAQMKVMLEAFDKFVERNDQYADLWRGDTVEEHATQVKHKAKRCEHTVIGVHDNAIDCINYAIFMTRKANGE